MSRAWIQAEWRFEQALHIGTGLAKPGYADRIVRKDSEGNPYLPGDAVKGAIRLSAERLSRWFAMEGMREEAENSSQPQHPALARVFAGAEGHQYRFRPAICKGHRTAVVAASTALKDGVAEDKTLRFVESWAGGVAFHIEVTAGGLDTGKGKRDELDFKVLAVALLLTDSIGGKRSSGLGQITVSNVRYRLNGGEEILTPDVAEEWAKAAAEHLKGGA